MIKQSIMNKNIFTLIVLLSGSSLAFSQSTEPADSLITVAGDTLWNVNGTFGLKFNQVTLTNWAKGGQNSLAGNATFDIEAKYAKDKIKWENRLHLGYGQSKQGEGSFNKTDDQIVLNSSMGYELKGPWHLTISANFRTQFSQGFKLPNDSVVISTFMAPAYLVTGLALEYKSNNNFVFLTNPIANKTVFVLDDKLSAKGAYGVDTLAKVRSEFGAYISFSYKKEIIKNVTFTTNYAMFADYKDLAVWDINWDVIFNFKINSYLAAKLSTNLIYDQDVKIPVDNTGDGIKESFGARVQFRQALGIGFTVKF